MRCKGGEVTCGSHRGCERVINEGDTSTCRQWELCQILTDTPAAFYSWNQQCEHDTTLLLGNACILGIICPVYTHTTASVSGKDFFSYLYEAVHASFPYLETGYSACIHSSKALKFTRTIIPAGDTSNISITGNFLKHPFTICVCACECVPSSFT